MDNLQDSVESSKFVLHKGRILGKFDSRKDLQPTKLESRSHILLISYIALDSLFDTKLSGFYIILIIWPFHGVKK